MSKKNNKSIITIIIIIALIIIGTGIVYYFDKKQDRSLSLENIKINKGNSEVKEANRIKEENKDVINNTPKTAAVQTVRAIDENDHVKGNIDAPVQMIIYDDFECPFCAGFAKTVDQIVENFGDQVVVAFRHFPLRFHPNAISAALASECAAEQDEFWAMHDLLFADNLAGEMSIEEFKKDAEELDLNSTQFNDCLDSEKYMDKVQEHIEEGKQFGITGTPANFINSIPYPGAIPFEDFTDSQGRERSGMKSIIENKLAEVENK